MANPAGHQLLCPVERHVPDSLHRHGHRLPHPPGVVGGESRQLVDDRRARKRIVEVLSSQSHHPAAAQVLGVFRPQRRGVLHGQQLPGERQQFQVRP
ncbi:MAG: hypothetical protein WCF12_03290 [Propionicimonas sp.]